MNRLQTLRECVYNARGRSCTCFTGSSSGIGGGVSNVNGQKQPAGIVPIIDPTHDQGIVCTNKNATKSIVHYLLFFKRKRKKINKSEKQTGDVDESDKKSGRKFFKK